MKILQVNCVYKKGSTGKITYDLHKGLLEHGIDSVVCYGRGYYIKSPSVVKTCPEWYAKLNKLWSMVTGIMYGGCFFSTNRLIKVIRRENPDVVHLQCLNGYFINIYRLITWLKKNQKKTILTLHAEFMYTGGCSHSIDCNKWSSDKGCSDIKCKQLRKESRSLFIDRTSEMWNKMYAAFDGFDNDLIITSVSPWLMERAKRSAILKEKQHCVVFNGVDIEVFRPYDTRQLRASLGIEDEKVIFYATPAFSTDPNHIKGGYYVIELAKRLKNQNVKILIAGAHEPNLNIPSNIVLLGNIEDQRLLAHYYSMADITLLTSKRETFSMVTVESLCCGTPVVGFKAGGPEQIAISDSACFVKYGDIDELTDQVRFFINKIKKNNISNKARSIYSNKNIVKKYIKCYELLLN